MGRYELIIDDGKGLGKFAVYFSKFVSRLRFFLETEPILTRRLLSLAHTNRRRTKRTGTIRTSSGKCSRRSC